MSSVVLVGDCARGLASVEAMSASCVVADPPYFKVVGGKDSWDYQWRCEDDYIAWCRGWFTGAHRVLRSNGHFWLWGYFDILARCHSVLLSLGFKHRQTVIWDKGLQAVAGRKTSTYKQYPNVVEYCANYVKWDREWLRNLLLSQQKALGISSLEMNKALGVKTNGGGMWSIFTGKNVCEQIPTEKKWAVIQRVLSLTHVPYSAIEQVWNPIMGVSNVWSDIPPVRGNERLSPAQKPDEAVRRIVLPTSRSDDLVVDLFAGSLGVAAVCAESGRNSVSIEQDRGLVDKAIIKRKLDPVEVQTIEVS